jgi:hypothetical protein
MDIASSLNCAALLPRITPIVLRLLIFKKTIFSIIGLARSAIVAYKREESISFPLFLKH